MRKRNNSSPLSRVVHWFLFILILWATGFIVFLASIPQPHQNKKIENVSVDAIIVLTGGAERLKDGIRLMRDGKANKLFVSGVKPGITQNQLLSSLEPSDFSVSDEILAGLELGYEAGNTIGNAEETAYWLAERGFSRIILVTANYHMNRALLEFRASLPWVQIIPYAAYPPEMLDPYWWGKPKTVGFLLLEYHKFVAALLRQFWLGLPF